MSSKNTYTLLLLTFCVAIGLTLTTSEGQAAYTGSGKGNKITKAKKKKALKKAIAKCNKKFKKNEKKKKACIKRAKKKYGEKPEGDDNRGGPGDGRKVTPAPEVPVPPPAKPIEPKSLELEAAYKAQKVFQAEMLKKKTSKAKVTAAQKKAYYTKNHKLAVATNKVVNGVRKSSWKMFLKAQHDYDLAVELNELYTDIIPEAEEEAVGCEATANTTYNDATSEIIAAYDEQLQETRTSAREDINELKTEKESVIASLRSSISKYRVTIKSTKSNIKSRKKNKTYKGKAKTHLDKKLKKAREALASKKASLEVSKSNYNSKIKSKRTSLAEDVNSIKTSKDEAIAPHKITLDNDLRSCEVAWTTVKNSYESQRVQIVNLAKTDWATNGMNTLNKKSNDELLKVSNLQTAIKTTISNILFKK